MSLWARGVRSFRVFMHVPACVDMADEHISTRASISLSAGIGALGVALATTSATKQSGSCHPEISQNPKP